MKNKIDKQALREKIQSLEGLSNEDKSQLLALLAEQKKYGIVWEDSPEEAEEMLREKIPVLREVVEKRLDEGGDDAPNHVLIEGDNLHALTALTYTHEGKVDVIYIDPPYNTGNKDFVYNDSFVDSEDSYRHSKWLSFMEKRLRIAKKLLSDKGVIFISIDDNEQANLKLLCDEVFGFDNFINTVSIKAKASSGASGGGEDKKLKKNIEYLHIYCKNRDFCTINFPLDKQPLMDVIEEKKEEGKTWSYTYVMYNEGTKHYVKSISAGNGDEIKIYKVFNYEIRTVSEIMKKELIREEDVYNKYIDKIFTTENAQTSIRDRIRDAVDIDNDYYIAEYVPVSGRNKGKLINVGFIGTTKRLVSYLKNTCTIEDDKVYKIDKIGTLWDDLSWSSVSKEGGVSFPAGKKPIALIKRIIAMIPSKRTIVLDYFAGSASTAHAVMDLNKEDKGCRTAIVITNNENQICETKSYVRCKNIIYGYNNVEGLNSNNLRYYKTDFIPRDNSLTGKRKLMSSCTDLLCIKNDLYKEETSFGRLKLKATIARYFNDGKKQMLIIYNVDAIEDIVEEIKQMPEDTKLQVYVFSTTNYAMDTDFEEVSDKVSLCALPAAIYNAYLKVLPKKKELETNEDNEEIEA